MKIPPLLLLAAVLSFDRPLTFAQGSLTPPGAPAATMKTLDQVEARKIVNSTNTPGNGTNLFIISSPGSYYLTASITGVSGMSGIQITADNVTLDLNGFSLVGVAGATQGIVITGPHRNLHISNGVVQSWPSNAITGSSVTNSQFDRLYLSQNGDGLRCSTGNRVADVSVVDSSPSSTGIKVGTNCRVSACSATNNGNGYVADTGSIIIGCTANNNSGDGMQTVDASTIIGCTARSNGHYGIFAGVGSVVKDCAALLNATVGIAAHSGCVIADCVADFNGTTTGTDAGIFVDVQGIVRHCTASNNTGSGIFVLGNTLVLENQCNANSADGIKATGGLSRIDSNHTAANTGIGINAGNDWVVRNSSGANTGGNIVGAGADIAPSQTAVTATNPFANMP